MKQYFMQSKVYQAFKEEETKEIEENRFAIIAQQQSGMLKSDFTDLTKNFAQL
jgi:hypothetical protein